MSPNIGGWLMIGSSFSIMVSVDVDIEGVIPDTDKQDPNLQDEN